MDFLKETFAKASANSFAIRKYIFMLAAAGIVIFNIWQMFFNCPGYADNGEFQEHFKRCALKQVNTPEFADFPSFKNQLADADMPLEIPRCTTDAVVLLTRGAALLNNRVFDLRFQGAVFLLAYLAGITLLLNALRKKCSSKWFFSGTLLLTAAGVYPYIGAYFFSLHTPGAFIGCFTLFSGLAVSVSADTPRRTRVLLAAAAAAALFAASYSDIVTGALFIFMLPFVITLLPDGWQSVSKTRLRIAVFVFLLIAAAAGLCCVNPKPEADTLRKYQVYVRYILPSAGKQDVGLLKDFRLSEAELARLRSSYNQPYPWYFNGYPVLEKHLDKLPSVPHLAIKKPVLAVRCAAKFFRENAEKSHGLGMFEKSPSVKSRVGGNHIFTAIFSQGFLLVLLASALISGILHLAAAGKKRLPLQLFHAGVFCSTLYMMFSGFTACPAYETMAFAFIRITAGALAVSTLLLASFLLSDLEESSRFKSQINWLRREFPFLVFALGCTVLMEQLFYGKLITENIISGKNLYFEYLMVLLMILPLRILAGRKSAGAILFMLTALWGVSNLVKTQITGDPILPDEMPSISHIWQSLVFVSRTPAFYKAVTFIVLCVAVAVLLFDTKSFRRHRTAKCVLFALALAGVFSLFKYTEVPSALCKEGWERNISLADQFKRDGLLVRFRHYAGNRVITPAAEAYSLLEREKTLIAAEISRRPFDTKRKPHLIFVLNEAAFDLGRLPGVSFPDGVPFSAEKLAQELKFSPSNHTLHGTLQSPVFGSHTVKAEFEVLTGISSGFIPHLPYVYLSSRKVGSVASLLKERGYDTTVLHPYFKEVYDREKVMPNLGFDRFLDFKAVPGWSDDFPFCPDSHFYQKLVDYLRENSKTPQFILGISIQNHGPYDSPRLRRVAQSRFVTDVPLRSDLAAILQRYSTGLKLTRDALHSFIWQINMHVKEPVVVVIFGDHRPILGMSHEVYRKLDNNKRDIWYRDMYKTEYLIWSNHPIPHPEQLPGTMKMYELGRSAACASGALPYDRYLYLFDKLRSSKVIYDATPGKGVNSALFLNGNIEPELTPHFKMYHALCYRDFTGKE